MSRVSRLRGRCWTARHRAANALCDLRDRWLHGYCCAAPSTMLEDGAYHFWRCGRKRGHKGPHRTVNYLWGHEGGGYSPIPHDQPSPPRLDRHPTLTRRQRRARDQWERQRRIDRWMGA